MLSVALATVRTRWVTFVGAFVALALGTGMIAMMLLALFSTFSTPHHGPQRFAGAPVVVAPKSPVADSLSASEDPDDQVLHSPATIPASVVSKVAATGAVIADRTFAAQPAGGAAGTVGHEWSAAALGSYRLTAGRAPSAADEIVIGGGSPSLVGSRIEVATASGLQEFTVVGTTDVQWFENAVFFSDAEAARLSPGVNALVAAGPAAAVQRAVGSRQLVLTGDDRRLADPDPSGGADLLTNAQAMAGTTTGIAVFVAGFIVIATFAFVVEQRRRELALLRLVGATPKQVRRMVLTEATLVGVLAAATGCALGPLGAGALNRWMTGHGMAPPWFHISVDPVALVIAFVVGVAAALVGAATVAFRASRVRPIESLREAVADRRTITPVRLLLGTALLLGAVASGIYVSFGEPVEAVNSRKYAMVPLLFTGAFALLAPVVLPPVVRLVTWPLARLGAGSLLVRQNLLTARRRTAATVAPVVVAVGLVATMLCVQTTGDQSKVQQLRAETNAALVVLPAHGASSLDRPTLAALAAVPGVSTTPVTPTTVLITASDGSVEDAFNAKAVDPSAMGGVIDPHLVSGSLQHLAGNFLVIGEQAASEDDLSPGDPVTAWLPDGTRTTLRIAAVVDTGLGSDEAYLSSAEAGGGRPTLAWVQPLPGTPLSTAARSLGRALEGQAATDGSSTAYFDSLRFQEKQANQSASTVVLGIAVAYALIAVANTLVMAAAGRRRELAALSLAGSTPSQSLRVIAGESAAAVLVGTLLAGLATLAVLATQWTTLIQFVSSVPVGIPWAQSGEAAGLCAVIAVGAGVLSGWRITRRRAVELAGLRE